MKRLLAISVCLLLCLWGMPSLASDSYVVYDDEEENPLGNLTPAVTERYSSDAEAGIWTYVSPDLNVTVTRCTEGEGKTLRIWYEAEVWSQGPAWSMVTYDTTTTESGEEIPCYMSHTAKPYAIAQKNKCVLAINGDYAFGRYRGTRTPATQKNRVGILLRAGRIYSENTYSSSNHNGYVPNLDNLVLYTSGLMEVYDCDEHTAQEYVDMGASDVLAFGPILIRDGMLNEEDVSVFGQENAPRTAIGMVEPGHYFAMMLEGRAGSSGGSIGGPVSFLAEKMLEKGCTLAYNLDGGRTSCILFMGEQLNQVEGHTQAARYSPELLAIGTSDLLEQAD